MGPPAGRRASPDVVASARSQCPARVRRTQGFSTRSMNAGGAAARQPEPAAAAGGQTFIPRPFHPAWWLPGPHAQTVAGKYLRPATGVRYRRERVETPDGDFVDLDFASVPGRAEPPPDAPLVLVTHGLEGSAQSAYVLETCRSLWDAGMRGVALNFRSCSGEPNRLPRFYHAGDTGDVGFVLELLASRFPGVPLAAVGFSLGGNVLLKYLGEQGGRAPLAAAVSVSVPFDLSAGADALDESRIGRIYVAIFLRSLRRKWLGKGEQLRGPLDRDRIMAARTFREFDDAGTARLHGFRDVDHYYGSSSSAQYLPAIRRPTLLVQALDDPFLPREALPHAAVRDNPWLTAAFAEHGGHVGFIGGQPWAPELWAEREAARFLALQLGLEPR